MKKLLYISIYSCITLGIFLRFYNLNWGAPFYFHPDERNIIYSIGQLSFPHNMNPHFFAYGSLPIYTTYFLGVLINTILLINGKIQNAVLFSVSFEMSVLILRIISALLSTATVLIIYKIATLLTKEKLTHIVSVLLASTSVGFIQYSHFGTFEMWLTLFGALLCFYILKYIQTRSFKDYLFSSINVGILIAIKVSSLAFLSVFPVIFILIFLKERRKHKHYIFFAKSILYIFTAIVISASVYLTSSPYSYIAYEELQSSLRYESSVALGTLPVFYIGSFFNTIPILHQFIYVFPFIISPLFTILFIPALIYFVYFTYKNRSIAMSTTLLFFFILLFSQATLFVKWTRYMIPILPFIYIILAFFISALLHNKKIQPIKNILILLFILLPLIHLFSYSKTVLFAPDTRIQAVEFAKNTIPHSAYVVSEMYDLGIIAFNPRFPSIQLFNFYDLDNISEASEDLNMVLTKADYIILPSQRVIRSRTVNHTVFPVAFSLYKSLENETLGFKKIYETPCDIFCKITYMGDPLFHVEESINVFDRPTVYIYKKVNQ